MIRFLSTDNTTVAFEQSPSEALKAATIIRGVSFMYTAGRTRPAASVGTETPAVLK